MSALSTTKTLAQSIQNNWNTYASARAKSPNGVCGNHSTPPASLQALAGALGGCSQIVSMLKSFGGYAASYASQLQTAVAAVSAPKTVAGAYDICVNPTYGSQVGNAVGWMQTAYNALLQQVQQIQSASMQSLPGTLSGNLTVAVLGWQYSARPIASQVQGMFAGTGLTVYSVKDTGQNDPLGNPLYVAFLGGNAAGSPASKAGDNGAGYNVILCGSTQWCLGCYSYASLSISPVKEQPPQPVHLQPVKVNPPPSGGYRFPMPVGKVGVHIQGGNTGVNAPFALTQGHRIATSTQAAGGLPADFLNQTVQTVQAQVSAAGIAANVVSVKYSPDGTTLYIEEDHCGPTTMTSNPFSVTDNGVTVTTTYTDMGPAATCGMSKGAKVALGFGALALLAGGAWWALS